MKRIFIGMSGGVDSSVAAALLQREGYDVTGVYMKNWTQDPPGVKCPWREDLNDARAVAAHLDIPFKVYDFETQYRDKVVEYLIDEYKTGRTPNPDIMCNQEIKFKLFIDTALADGADMVATGHYATVKDGRLFCGIDENKDQTYFLYRMSREALEHTIMPIGAYTKPQVREMAREFGLLTADKKDSQGICFVGPVGMRAFLSQYVDSVPGPIMLRGQEIGRHDGAIFYTTGQRQGLGVGGGAPFYVTGKDMSTNAVYVTDDPLDLEINAARIQLKDLYLHGEMNTQSIRVRFRHRGRLIDSTMSDDVLQLKEPVSALAAGQSAVIYDGKRVVGGGIIATSSTVSVDQS